MRVLLILLMMLPMAAQAQEPPPDAARKWSASLYTGAVSVITRGEKREYACARATISGQLTDAFTVFARGDVTGAQDGGALDITAPRSFRTVALAGGARRTLGPLRASLLGGVTYSIEGDQGRPIDARLFTVAALVGGPIGDGGYLEVGAGHHGPVGGPALLLAASVPVHEGAFTVLDIAFPLQRDAFRQKAYVVTVGAQVRVKTLRF